MEEGKRPKEYTAKGMRLLKGLTAAVGAVSALYLLVGKLIEGAGMSYRFWVDVMGYATVAMLLPLLLLLLFWFSYRLKGRTGWGQLLLAAGMTVVYLCWLAMALLTMLLSFHEEYRLVGDLLVVREGGYPGESVEVCYRQKNLFFRVPGELTDADGQQYLEEKYGTAFVALQEGLGNGRLFWDVAHPDVTACVYLEGIRLEDNYVEALTAWYLEEGCQELGIKREYGIHRETVVGGVQIPLKPYFYMVLQEEGDIGAFVEDTRRLLQYVLAQTDFYEGHRGFLHFLYREGAEEVKGSLSFGQWGTGREADSGHGQEDWLNADKLEERVRQQYEQGVEQVLWRQAYRASQEAARREAEGEPDAGTGTGFPEDPRTDAARRIYEEVLEN